MATTNLTYSGCHWGVNATSSDINKDIPTENKTIPIGGNPDYTYTTGFKFDIPSGVLISQLSKLTFTIKTTESVSLNYIGDLFFRTTDFSSTQQMKNAAKNNSTNEGWVSSVIATGGYTLTFTFDFSNKPALSGQSIFLVVHYSGTTGDIKNNAGFRNIYNNRTTCEVTYTSYTKNDAPKSIEIASNIVALNGSTTLSWSGAGAGAANTINEYSIYYKDGSLPTISTFDGIYTTTSTSCSVEVSSTRGQTRYFKVVAESPYSGYSSDLSSVSASVKTNSLPSEPTISVEKTTLPSSGGTVVFNNISPGKDNDGQTYTVYYSTSYPGKKTKVDNNELVENVNSSSTYYFWTFDGLEYSESKTTIEILLNTKPKIEEIGSIETTSYKNNNISYTSNLSIPLKFNKSSGILRYALYYTIEGDSEKRKDYSQIISSKNLTLSLNINNLLKEEYNNKKIDYKIGFILEDNYEDSIQKFTSSYQISPAPTRKDNETQFYDKLELQFAIDTEITSIKYEIKSEYLTDINFDTSSYKNDGKIKLFFKNKATSDFSQNIIILFDNGQFEKTATFTLKVLRGYELKSLSLSSTSLKPFSSPQNGIASITWPFGATEQSDERCSFGFAYTYNNNTTEYDIVRGNEIKDADALKLRYNYENCLKLKTSGEYGGTLCNTDIYLKGVYQVQIAMYIKTSYAVFYSDKINLIFDFEEVPSITNFQIGYKDSNDSFASFSERTPLVEGIKPVFTIQYTQYTQSIPTIIIYKSFDKNNWEEYYSHTPINFNYYAENKVQNFTLTPSENFPEITQTDNNKIHFKIKVLASTLSSEKDNSISAKKFTSSKVYIKNIKISDSNIIVDYTTEKGYNDGPSTKLATLLESGEKIISSYESTADLLETQSITFPIQNRASISSVAPLQIKFISTYTYNYTNEITIVKEFLSSTFVKFLEAPTVSYRKNLIGINAYDIDNDPEASESALIIKQTETKKYVTLIGATETRKVLGQIDLSTGALSGFTINGGTW